MTRKFDPFYSRIDQLTEIYINADERTQWDIEAALQSQLDNLQERTTLIAIMKENNLCHS